MTTLKAALAATATAVNAELDRLLPVTDGRGVCQVAGRIQEKIASLRIPHAHSQVAPHITISLGGFSLVPSPDIPPALLLQSADKLLYQAKQSGRNRLLYASHWEPAAQLQLGATHGP